MHAFVTCSIHLNCYTLLTVDLYCNLAIHSRVGGRLGCFQFLTFVNNRAISFCVRSRAHICSVFCERVSRKSFATWAGIAGSGAGALSLYWSNAKIFFRVPPNPHSINSAMRISIAPHPRLPLVLPDCFALVPVQNYISR